jgi:hypothetical protein
MRSKVVAALTTVLLLGGAGGAVALSGLDSHPNTNGGAAESQYKHHHGCGHKGHPGPKRCRPKGHRKGVGPGKGGHYGRKGKGHHGKKHQHHGKHHHHHGKHGTKH